MSDTGIRGFDLYAAPAGRMEDIVFKKTMISTDSFYNISYEFDDCFLRDITINFPLYNDVKSLCVGLERDSVLTDAMPYSIEKPVVFYGSSVTQGACASRPGLTYPALLSRWLDVDFINLGFSGNDRGEKALADYIASIDMSAFVYGYGYNTPTVEHYEKTHYPFYDIIRKNNPDLPIIIMSPPMCPILKNNEIMDFFLKVRDVATESFEKSSAASCTYIFMLHSKL